MARQAYDTTAVYRYKVTKSGVHDRDGWGHKAGDAYESVNYIGPYQRKVPLANQWRGRYQTLKVELQELQAVGAGELKWETIAIRMEEDDPADVG